MSFLKSKLIQTGTWPYCLDKRLRMGSEMVPPDRLISSSTTYAVTLSLKRYYGQRRVV